MPSPALRTGSSRLALQQPWRAGEGWRRMIASAPSARSVRPVSFSDLALFNARREAQTSVVSAPRPLAASSKLVRVRVEDS